VSDPGTARAWGWVAHLQDGGTTPWRSWAGTAEPAARFLPGAQQLELLRLLNDVRPVAPTLARRVLAADPPRRSRPALPLTGGAPVPDHGPRPVDPVDLPAEELAELAAVVLAQQLATVTPPRPRVGRRRPWAVRYHLHGDPELARDVRRHLVAHGRPPAPHGGRVIVMAADAGRMLTDLWTHAALGGGIVPWSEWWAQRVVRDRLPVRADLLRSAQAGLAIPGARGVHVVADPALAPRLAGLRRPLPPPPTYAAAAVDLGRRVVGALRPVVPPETRHAVVGEVLRPMLARLDGPPLVVPSAHRAWVDEHATQVLARIQAAPRRYPVHGDPERLLRVDRPGAETVRPRDTLAAGIRLLLKETGPAGRAEEES
jgi:hypothetical protein